MRSRAQRKKITLFGVLYGNDNENFLTFTNTKAEATEFVIRFVVIKNLEHYRAWCTLRDLDYKDFLNMTLYFEQVISDEEKKKYNITKIYYTLSDLAAILRLANGCIAIGSSFDHYLELLATKAIASHLCDPEELNHALNTDVLKDLDDQKIKEPYNE